MSRTVYVYALCDPQTLQIKYVGKTLNANGRYDAHCRDEKKQSIDEYPDPISLDDAADLAARFMPDLYPDKRKARNSIRTASYRGAIPGAWRRDDSPNGWDIWRYDKTLLVSWLSGDLKWMPATKKQNRGAPTLPATLIPPGAWH